MQCCSIHKWLTNLLNVYISEFWYWILKVLKILLRAFFLLITMICITSVVVPILYNTYNMTRHFSMISYASIDYEKINKILFYHKKNCLNWFLPHLSGNMRGKVPYPISQHNCGSNGPILSKVGLLVLVFSLLLWFLCFRRISDVHAMMNSVCYFLRSTLA